MQFLLGPFCQGVNSTAELNPSPFPLLVGPETHDLQARAAQSRQGCTVNLLASECNAAKGSMHETLSTASLLLQQVPDRCEADYRSFKLSCLWPVCRGSLCVCCVCSSTAAAKCSAAFCGHPVGAQHGALF